MKSNDFKSMKCDDKNYQSIRNTPIYWNCNSNEIIALKWPLSESEKSFINSFQMSGFACYSKYRQASDINVFKMMMSDIMALIIRDNVSPDAVHNTFLNIREYREVLALDMPNYDGDKYND